MDVWGPFKLEAYDQKWYFLTIVDDYNIMTWVFLMELKSDAFVVIKQFISYAKNQFDLTIKTI